MARYVRNKRLADALHHQACPDGLPCQRGTRGVLTRRHVTPAALVHIRKEANRLEDREAGLLTDQDLEHF